MAMFNTDSSSPVTMEHGSSVEETPSKVSPFAKTSPFWKTYERNELHNRAPQSPHFSPLFDVNEEFREYSAIGMIVTFSELLEEVKGLQFDVSTSRLSSLSSYFAEFEKYGFDVAKPQSLICKVLALRTGRAKKADEKRFLEEEIQANKMIKQNAEEEMAELERKSIAARERKEAAEKKIVESESLATTIVQEIEDLELEFQTTVSSGW